MAKTVEFYFDFGSPYSYLAYKALPGIAAAQGAQIAWRPMLLGGVFTATGNNSPVDIPAKGKWTQRDLQTWTARNGCAFRRNPHFPLNKHTTLRVTTGLHTTKTIFLNIF